MPKSRRDHIPFTYAKGYTPPPRRELSNWGILCLIMLYGVGMAGVYIASMMSIRVIVAIARHFMGG